MAPKCNHRIIINSLIMQKRSGYVVVLPCCVSCLSVLIFLLALRPHTRKPKSTNFGWNPGCLHKNGKHLCWPRSSFVSTLRHVTHVRSQAKKQSTILLNCSLPNAFYSFLRQQRIHSLGMLRPSCGKTCSSTLHHISIIWSIYDVRVQYIKSQAEQIVDWPWLAKTTATPSVLTFWRRLSNPKNSIVGQHEIPAHCCSVAKSFLLSQSRASVDCESRPPLRSIFHNYLANKTYRTESATVNPLLWSKRTLYYLTRRLDNTCK